MRNITVGISTERLWMDEQKENLQEKERRMEKKELKLRLRGLLALVLAFGMMFGTSMTVLAHYAETPDSDLDVDGNNNITRGQNFTGGSEIYITHSSGAILKCYFYSDENTLISDFNDNRYSVGRGTEKVGQHSSQGIYKKYSVTLDPGYNYQVEHYTSYLANGNTPIIKVWLLKTPAEQDPVLPSQPVASLPELQRNTGGNHKHSFQWIETLEPTLQNDGLMQHKCECGAIDDQYTIPGSLAYFRMYCAAIQNAPQNGTVEWNPYNFRCYTRRMMEELAKRPDVTLKTTYTEADGTVKSFTIPAGQAPADSEQFYGFTYLGNLYGWN